MAKTQKKVWTSQQDADLQSFFNQYIPATGKAYGPSDLMSEVKKTGTIDPASLAKLDIVDPSKINEIKSGVQKITGGKAQNQDYTQAELKDLLNFNNPSKVNEANLTDEELQQRQNEFEDLGQAKGQIDPATISRFLDSKLAGNTAADFYGIAKPVLMNAIINKGAYPNADELMQALQPVLNADSPHPKYGGGFIKFNNIAGIIDPLVNFAHDQATRDEASNLIDNMVKAPDTADDVSRIGTALAGRAQSAKNEAAVQDYFKTLPDALNSSRNDFINTQKQLGQDQLAYGAPQLLEQQNALGRLNSGAPGDALASYAGNIQGNIEDQDAQMQSSDNQFYFNAAYQNTVRQQLQGQTDYSTYLAGERSRVLSNQQNQFQQAQTTLKNYASNDLLDSQYQNQLKAYQAQLQKQQNLQNASNQAGLSSGIGSSVGGITGALIGSALLPGVGTVVGAGIGSSLGGTGGSAIGGKQ